MAGHKITLAELGKAKKLKDSGVGYNELCKIAGRSKSIHYALAEPSEHLTCAEMADYLRNKGLNVTTSTQGYKLRELFRQHFCWEDILPKDEPQEEPQEPPKTFEETQNVITAAIGEQTIKAQDAIKAFYKALGVFVDEILKGCEDE